MRSVIAGVIFLLSANVAADFSTPSKYKSGKGFISTSERKKSPTGGKAWLAFRSEIKHDCALEFLYVEEEASFGAYQNASNAWVRFKLDEHKPFTYQAVRLKKKEKSDSKQYWVSFRDTEKRNFWLLFDGLLRGKQLYLQMSPDENWNTPTYSWPVKGAADTAIEILTQCDSIMSTGGKQE